MNKTLFWGGLSVIIIELLGALFIGGYILIGDKINATVILYIFAGLVFLTLNVGATIMLIKGVTE